MEKKLREVFKALLAEKLQRRGLWTWETKDKLDNLAFYKKSVEDADTDPFETIVDTSIKDAKTYSASINDNYNYSPDTGLENAIMQNRKSMDRQILASTIKFLQLAREDAGLSDEARKNLENFLSKYIL